MKVFMVGGTGLLGSASAQEFIDRGHSVKTLSLPPLPEGAEMPARMEIIFGSYLDMSDDELRALFEGCDCFVFAAGVDERIEFPPPVYQAYKKYNIDPVARMLKIAKESGVSRSVIMGSYFSYFAREFPQMKLIEKHPYIKSRIEQEELALSFADDQMAVSVLELPYIFGAQKGRKPVWTLIVEQLYGMGEKTMYPKGGTTMVTVKQVAQSVVGAAEKISGGACVPVGYYNLTWNELLTIVHDAMGFKDRKIVNIPKIFFKLFGLKQRKDYKNRNLQPGIDPVGLADIMYMNAFIDKKWCEELGVKPDDINAAIFESIVQAVQAYKNGGKFIGMKGE